MTTKQILVTYHGGCPDGMGAALAAFLKFGGQADYVPVFHTEPFPDVLRGDLSGKTVYCLDYCHKQPDLVHVTQSAESVVLLDHYDGVKERTQEIFHAGHLDGKVDQSNSGAIRAWYWFFQGFPAPLLCGSTGRPSPMTAKHFCRKTSW